MKKEKQKGDARKFSRTSYNDYNDDYDDEPEYSTKKTPLKSVSQGKVVPIRTSASDVEVCIFKPANFGESQEVCNILLGGQPVIVNLEGIDVEEAQEELWTLFQDVFSQFREICVRFQNIYLYFHQRL